MTSLVLFLQAHNPRLLSGRGTFAAPFDDALNTRILSRLTARCYLPVNRVLCEVLERCEGLQVCIGVSGVLLDQAEAGEPRILESFGDLARIARQSGRVAFSVGPNFHSVTGLFGDGNKAEFKAQIKDHAAALQRLFGVSSEILANPALLYNDAIAASAHEAGLTTVLCEGRKDLLDRTGGQPVFMDRLRRVTVVARDRDASSELAQLVSRERVSQAAVKRWLAARQGKTVLVGLPYEIAAGYRWESTGLLDFLRVLPEAATAVPGVSFALPQHPPHDGDDREAIRVDESATVSWLGKEQTASPFVGERAQQELFNRYEDLELRVKASGDEQLLRLWHNLGTTDHFSFMGSGSAGNVPVWLAGEYPTEPTAAVLRYATLLDELQSNLAAHFASVHIGRSQRQPRILLVTPEVTELPRGFGNLANAVSVKGGGLADISAALVGELVRLGLDVHVALPKYDRKMRDHAHISQEELDRMVGLFQSSEPIHLVQDSAFAHLQDVYEEGEHHAAVHRAAAFQRGVINTVFDAAVPENGKMLVHCNDWMTGLVPAAAKARGFRSVFTVHNIHTGMEPLRTLEECGIDVSRFWHELYLERHPDSVTNPWDTVGVDFLLSGISAADYVNTVSPTFLQEIVNGYFPEMISWQLRDAFKEKYRQSRASGIINAPKNTVDPRITRGLYINFDETNCTERKRLNKIAFQVEMGLRENPLAPLFFWPHRLYQQKGPGLLAHIAMSMVDLYHDDGLQIAVVGNGDPEWEQTFGGLSCGSNGRIAFANFDPMLSELGKAAADFIVMPSLYEPCGLAQMEGMRYGALPIVRATGGLSDTVHHLDISRGTGNGFVFNDFTPDALWWAVGEAMQFYREPPETRQRIVQRVMRDSMRNFNLEKTTLEYVRIYENLLGEKLV